MSMMLAFMLCVSAGAATLPPPCGPGPLGVSLACPDATYAQQSSCVRFHVTAPDSLACACPVRCQARQGLAINADLLALLEDEHLDSSNAVCLPKVLSGTLGRAPAVISAEAHAPASHGRGAAARGARKVVMGSVAAPQPGASCWILSLSSQEKNALCAPEDRVGRLMLRKRQKSS